MNKQELRFEYKDEEFSAGNMEHAYTMFLDVAWGSHYVDYLKKATLKLKIFMRQILLRKLKTAPRAITD